MLHRESGEPVLAVEERPVPTSDVPGEEAWPTQPFTVAIAPLSPHRVREEDAWGATEEDRAACRAQIAGLRNEGIFTPPRSPSEYSGGRVVLRWGWSPADGRDRAGERAEGAFSGGTLVLPSNIGGAHWGGLAFDPGRQVTVLPVNRHAAMVQLLPAEGFDWASADADSDRLGLRYERSVLVGTPYAVRRRPLLAPSGLPCTPPP